MSQTDERTVEVDRTTEWALGLIIGVLSGLAYGFLAVRRFEQFMFSSWDNAIFEQAVAGYASLQAPIVDVKGPGFNILGDHFSPIDALIAPFYRVFPTAHTIMLAQVVLIAVSVTLLTVLGVRVLGPAVGAAIGVLYAVSFGIQSAVEVDFHEVAFALPLLAMSGWAYVEQRYLAVAAWALPLLAVKEDMGLTVAAVGVVLWFAGERRLGLGTALVGMAGFILVTFAVLPAVASDGAYAYTSLLGGDRGVVATLFTSVDVKATTVLLTVAVTGFAALGSPWVLLAVPTLAWRMVGDNEYYWGTDFHYSLVLMPIVFVAMIDAVRRHRHRGRWVGLAVPVAAVVGVCTLVVDSPLSQLVDDDLWTDGPRTASARAAVDAVPEGVSVESDIALLSHLVSGRRLYWTGTIDLEGAPDVTPQYVAFDTQAGIGSPPDPLSYARSRYGGTWRTVLDRDGYVVVTNQPES